MTDPATGIRIGLPTKLVPDAEDAPHSTRWSSPHGEVRIETFWLKQPDLTLKELYTQEKKTPPTRRVSRSTLHDDDFSIHGMQGLKYFAVHAVKRHGVIRAFTVLYDQSMRGIVEPVANAMAAACRSARDLCQEVVVWGLRSVVVTGLVLAISLTDAVPL